jgi:malate synthase
MINLFKSPIRRRIEKKIEQLKDEREVASRKIDGKFKRRLHHYDIQIKVLKSML